MIATELRDKIENYIKVNEIQEALDVLDKSLKFTRWADLVVRLMQRYADFKDRDIGGTISLDEANKLKAQIIYDIMNLLKEVCRKGKNHGYYSQLREFDTENRESNGIEKPAYPLQEPPAVKRSELPKPGFLLARESQQRSGLGAGTLLASADHPQFFERQQLEETVHMLQDLLHFLPAGEREKRRKYGQKLSETQRQLNLLKQVTGQLIDLIGRAETKTQRLEKIEDLLKAGSLQKVDSLLDTSRLKKQQTTFLHQSEERQSVLLKTEQDLKDLAFEFLLKARLLSMLQPDAAGSEEAISLYEESLRTFPRTDTSIQFAKFLHAQGKSGLAKEVLNKALQQTGLPREEEVNLQYGLAFLSDFTNEQDKAKQYYETAISIGRQIQNEKPDNAKMLAEILLNYAVFYRKQRNYPAAMQCYHQSLQIWEEGSEHTPQDDRFEAIILFETGGGAL